ncbi:hypothetical protein RTF48_25095, partial [Escherichia coli]|uniref:hypothetical protein n=1 Tax=Escherichia coli TaxID=562 RepID=UPI0028EE0874
TLVICVLLVAAGSVVAALNWHRTWAAFAIRSNAGGSIVAQSAMDTFQTWVLVCLVSLTVAVGGLAWTALRRTAAHEATL